MAGTNYLKEFDDITTISNASSLSGVVGQTFDNHPVWSELGSEENRVYTTFTQDRYEFSVRAGRNKSIKYFTSATTEVELFDTQYMTKGWVTPAILGGVVVYTDLEKEQVEGSKDALISLQRVKMEALEDSATEILSQNLWGTGDANTTMGLGAFVPVSPGNYTVCGLSENTYPMWQPYYEGAIGAWGAYGYYGATKDKVWRAIRTVADGSRRVNLIVTDEATLARHHDKMVSKVQFHTRDQFGKIDSWDYDFNGIRVVADKDADADTLIGLQTKFCKLAVSRGMNGRVSPTRYLEKAPLVSYNFWVFRHQFLMTRRNVHFRLDGIQD